MLTIMTPTYNRKKTLPRCYESLLAQTDNRFEWLIIDDGSTDNTEEMVNQWVADGKIKIAYMKKENGGKASALNLAIDNLNSDYAVCLDSDDMFYPEMVAIVHKEMEDSVDNDNCCGLLALSHYIDGGIIGGKALPENINKITAVDIFLRLRYKTELVCVYKSEVLKNYRFPIFEGEKFVSPAWMQYEVTERRWFKVSHARLRGSEYMEDGLTRNKRRVIAKNPKGYTCVKSKSFKNSKRLTQILRHGIMYDCGCIISKDSNWLKNAPRKVWAVLLYPLAVFVYFKRFDKICKELRNS